MTTGGLISTVINYTDNVSATDADNGDRRARILQLTQETFEDVWNYREWPWRFRGPTTLAITAGSADLPADFADFGQNGGVFDVASGRKFSELPIQMFQERILTGANNNVDDEFAVFNQATTDGDKKIYVPTAVTSIKIFYLATASTLVDATDATNNLFLIPARWHQTVILPGVVARVRTNKGDGRDWMTRYLTGLGSMVAGERSKKTTVQRVPYYARMW